MPSKTNYFQELKRRKVFTSIGLYAVSSFVIMQVTALIAPALMLPEWTQRLVFILLILGFPIVIIFAWIYDRTPKGFIKTDSLDNKPNTISEDEFPRDAKGNSAIVYIDILDYSKLMNQDEKKAIDLVHYKHKIILPFIEKYEGLLINRLGDGTLCVFRVRNSIELNNASCQSNLFRSGKYWDIVHEVKWAHLYVGLLLLLILLLW